jgi:hypothetical protein
MIDAIAIVRQRILSVWNGWYPPGPWRFIENETRLRAQLIDLYYNDLSLLEGPPIGLQSSTFINNGSLPATQRFTVSKTTEDAFTWTLSETLSASMSLSVKIPFVGSAETSFALDVSSTQGQTKSVARTWEYSAEIPVPPHTTVETQFSIFEGVTDTPFQADYKVIGPYAVVNPNGSTNAYPLDASDFNNNRVKAHGVFKGVQGTRYVVVVNEVTAERALGGQILKSHIVDIGQIEDGKTVSFLNTIKSLSEAN